MENNEYAEMGAEVISGSSDRYLVKAIERANLALGICLFLVAIFFVTNLDVKVSKAVIFLPYYFYLSVTGIFALFSLYYCLVWGHGVFNRGALILGLLAICWLIVEMGSLFLKMDLGPTPVFKAHIISCLIFLGFVLAFQNPLFGKFTYYGILVGTILGALLCLLQIFWPNFLTDWIPPRSAGFSGNPNSAGFAITFGFFAVIWRVPTRYRVYFAVLCISGIVATMSRTLLGAFLVGLVVLIIFKTFRHPKWPRQVLLATGVTVAFFVMAYTLNPVFRFGIDGQYFSSLPALANLVVKWRPTEVVPTKVMPAEVVSTEVVPTEVVPTEVRKELTEHDLYALEVRRIEESGDDLERLSLSIRINRMLAGLKIWNEYLPFGMKSIESANYYAGHSALFYYLLAYGLPGFLVMPIFLAMAAVTSKAKVVIPWGVVLVVTALGYQDPLADWGVLIMGAAFLTTYRENNLLIGGCRGNGCEECASSRLIGNQ